MRWLKLEVARYEMADVYVQVPDDFDESILRHGIHASYIGHAIDKSHTDYCWSKDGWQEYVDVLSVEETTEKVAKLFPITEIDTAAMIARVEELRREYEDYRKQIEAKCVAIPKILNCD